MVGSKKVGTMVQKVGQALLLMQPDEIREAEAGRFLITLRPSNPYYKAENPLAFAVEVLRSGKVNAKPGYWSRNEDRVLFDVYCTDDVD